MLIQTFRADGVTPLSGSAVECETIQYRLLLVKPGGAETCAFEGGSLTLTTPDGVVHPIDGTVPCIGGTCDQCRAGTFLAGIAPYVFSASGFSCAAVISPDTIRMALFGV